MRSGGIARFLFSRNHHRARMTSRLVSRNAPYSHRTWNLRPQNVQFADPFCLQGQNRKQQAEERSHHSIANSSSVTSKPATPAAIEAVDQPAGGGGDVGQLHHR